MASWEQKTLAEKQIELLKCWSESCQKDIYTLPDRPDLMYYGDGTNGWGTQTNQKAFAALALLATAEGGDKKWLPTALAMLRYSLESHITGNYHTTDGNNVRWGHTWISILGVERMMYGVEAIWDYMTDGDKESLKKMLISESDWQLSERIFASVENDAWHNKPESNMWEAALLLRTAAMYPDAPNVESYLRKGREFAINSISVPSDAVSDKIIDGKPVSEWHLGANFSENLALDHHGYLNIGYMVITLSQIAMYHFSMRRRGLQPDQAIYHNARRLWQLVRSCLFDDSRLWRIGGDNRVRYCYCQAFILPVLCLAQDCFGEDTAEMEHRWADMVKKEMDYNADGTFLSKRCELFRERSPLYFTRLESDRANVIGFSLYYRTVFDNFAFPANESNPVPILSQWNDHFHGACMVRSDKRFASFSWRSASVLNATFLSPKDSSVVEWTCNLVSEIKGDGNTHYAVVKDHYETMLKDGFATCGSYVWHTCGLLAEQISEEDTILSHIGFVVLPDGITAVTVQRGVAVKTCHVQCVKPLNLKIPNDVYNDFKRDYALSEDKQFCSVDGSLSVTVLYGGALEIYNPPYRQIGLTVNYRGGKWTPYHERGFLHCDELLVSPVLEPRFYSIGETAYDIAAALRVDGVRAEAECTVDGDLRRISVCGADGKLYLVTANLGDDCFGSMPAHDIKVETI